jgi:DNA-binding MarR family transcriptional regulator
MKLEEVIKTTKFRNNRHKAALNLLYTAYWLKTHISAILKQQSLTSEQYNVLRILKGKHPESMCVKDIGSRVIEKNSNVPRIIDRLVIKKLATRYTSKEDKRETLISLTKKGIETLEQTNKLVEEAETKLISISEDDALLLNDLLEKIRLEE